MVVRNSDNRFSLVKNLIFEFEHIDRRQSNSEKLVVDQFEVGKLEKETVVSTAHFVKDRVKEFEYGEKFKKLRNIKYFGKTCKQTGHNIDSAKLSYLNKLQELNKSGSLWNLAETDSNASKNIRVNRSISSDEVIELKNFSSNVKLNDNKLSNKIKNVEQFCDNRYEHSKVLDVSTNDISVNDLNYSRQINNNNMVSTGMDSEQHHNNDTVDVTENQDTNSNEDLINVGKNASELECIEIHRDQEFGELSKDEFGQRSFENLQDIDYVEAYNGVGGELMITRVAVLEHRLIRSNSENSDNDNKNTTAFNDDQNQNNLKNSDDVFKSEVFDGLDASNNYALNNRIYFPSDCENQVQGSNSQSKVEASSNNEVTYDNFEKNVEIRSTSKTDFDRTIKTETVYDVYQNPRIAKVRNVSVSEKMVQQRTIGSNDVEPTDLSRTVQERKHRKDYIIEELITTEKQYIKHLKKVVSGYMPIIAESSSPSSMEKYQHIFGNIKRIYNYTKKFYNYLRLCAYNHEEIAITFLSFEKLFSLYPLYYKNKPLADYYLLGEFTDLVKECENKLQDRLGLASYLLTPIQRMGKYKLFLEQIKKELIKSNDNSHENIDRAIELIHKQMTKGNDYIAIDSIKNCPINLLEQGSFILREKFNVVKPRKYESMLFLFENIILFTTTDPRNSELFSYRSHIKLNEMGIVTFDDQSLVFHLKRFAQYKKGPKEFHDFVVEAKNIKSKRIWTEEIEKRLWQQLVKCKEEQSELQKTNGRSVSTSDESTLTRNKIEYQSLPSDTCKRLSKSKFYFQLRNEV